MNAYLDGRDDTFDSREVIERIAELRAEIGESTAPDDFVFERQELADLEAFEKAAEGISDWQYGVTFIRDSYFEKYARELAEDIGAINSDEQWPLSYIDWKAAAEALQTDYTDIELCGETYWTLG